MTDARHHRAHAPGPAVILVPVPVGGSPEPARNVKPRWPRQDRVPPWRPATKPPGKVERLQRLVDRMARQDEIARRHMTEARHQAHQARCA